MQNDNESYGSASDLLDGHVLGNDKLRDPAMERSTRTSLDGNSIDIGEITESPDTDYMSTSAILHYCKSKILLPYLKLLTIMGLRPVVDSRSSKCAICFSHFHSAQVALLMLLGYVLQYMACFRRDRGFCYKLIPLAQASSLEYETYKEVCYGNVTLTYIGPSILHFLGFSYAVYLFRISDNEQLQNLMERVFLLSSYAPQGLPTNKPKRLLRTLWFFIVLSVLWMCMSLCSVNLMLVKGDVMFRWMETSSREVQMALRVLLVVCSLVHDMVQATVITSYCLQAQLLQAHLVFLKERLLNRSITPLNWMREISEFRKLLKYLNDELSPAVCLFTAVNVSWAVSGALWLLRLDALDAASVAGDTDAASRIAGVLPPLLWLAAAAAPFVQAARLSKECSRTQSVGHALCVRPFLHQDTSQEDIMTVLMYAATLRLQAKLFHCPIAGRYVYLLITVTVIILFSLGMCHYLQ